MKIVAHREKFLSAFSTAASVAPTRSPKDILKNVKLEVTGEAATLLATDMETGIRIDVPDVRVEAPGAAILPLARFASILRESSDETLTLTVEDSSTHVTGSRSKFQLPGADPGEFPGVPDFREEKFHEVAAGLFRELVRRTGFATDTESSRYALGGVLLEFHPDKIIAVGTDGRRLAKMEGPAMSVGGHESGESTFIVPVKAMHLMERAVGDGEAEIQVAARSNEILVKTSRATVFARLLEGRFPRWRDVFPQREGAVSVELPVGPFFSTVRQAAIATSEDSRGIDFTFGEGNVVLTGQAANVGEARVELPIAYDGEPIAIKLDPRYVSDFLKVLEPDKTFSLDLKNQEQAAVCSTDDGYGYVIMPLARDQ